jgi:hypothetical protein
MIECTFDFTICHLCIKLLSPNGSVRVDIDLCANRQSRGAISDKEISDPPLAAAFPIDDDRRSIAGRHIKSLNRRPAALICDIPFFFQVRVRAGKENSFTPYKVSSRQLMNEIIFNVISRKRAAMKSTPGACTRDIVWLRERR